MKSIYTFLLLSLFSLQASCSDNNASAPVTQQKPAQFANTDALVKVVMHTSAGDIEIGLDEARAPLTVKNFLAYVDKGQYNGTIFHRVIKGFMIQGGGFTTDYDRKETMKPIQNEANNGLKNEPFTIAMARTGDPHSATAQFFINTVNNRSLDHTNPSYRGWGYAVFGVVTKGQDVVKTIENTATGSGGPFYKDAPEPQIIINAVERVK